MEAAPASFTELGGASAPGGFGEVGPAPSPSAKNSSAPYEYGVDAGSASVRKPVVPAEPAVLCLDVGGSSVKSGVVLAGGSVVAGPHRTPLRSRGPAEDIVGVLAETLARLRSSAEGLDVRGIGVAMPGPFDYERGVSQMTGLGKFDAIRGLPLAEAVAVRARGLGGLPWRWVNDARAFALGELRYGAAVGAERVVFLTLGTGCGSAFAVGGKLISSGHGVPPDGYVYQLKHQGRVVDQLLSARGLVRLFREVRKERAESSREVSGVSKPGRLTAQKVGTLAATGDPAALEALNRFGALLAAALGPVFSAFEPQLVVLGGQVSRSLPFFGPAARSAGSPPLAPAAAADLAALRGAAANFLERTVEEGLR